MKLEDLLACFICLAFIIVSIYYSDKIAYTLINMRKIDMLCLMFNIFEVVIISFIVANILRINKKINTQESVIMHKVHHLIKELIKLIKSSKFML